MTIKAKFANGEEIVTRINCNREEAERYYIGKIFNVGSVRDDLQACVAVEVIEEARA